MIIKSYQIFSGALWRFAELANVIHAKKIRPFFEHLSTAFSTIAARPEDIVHDKLPEYYELIFRILGRSINDKEIKVSHSQDSRSTLINNEFELNIIRVRTLFN